MRAAAFFATLLVSGSAFAGDLDLAAGLGLGTSGGWPEDMGGSDGAIPYGSFRAGYRFEKPLIGPLAVVREGYAREDQRVLTLLSLGAQGWLDFHDVLPFARIAWAHQHEEFLDNAQAEPWGVLFGVGKAIRHRGGLTFALGADVPFARKKDLVWFVSGEAWFDWFFADHAPAPRYYVGGTLAIGLDYRL
jgi:hypothetical protein